MTIYKTFQDALRPARPVEEKSRVIGSRWAASVIPFDRSRLSDKDLIEQLEQERVTVADITRQLDDDKAEGSPAGPDWRQRAGKARRGSLVRIDLLEVEALKRGLVAVAPTEEMVRKAEKEARQLEQKRREQEAYERREREREEHQRRQMELLEARKKAKEDRIRLHNEAKAAVNASKAELFVQAAHRLHSKDTCERIWKRAMQMFPGHDAWRDVD